MQWLHVLLAILWFGYSLSFAAITIPALSRLPLVQPRAIGGLLGGRGLRVVDVVGPAVIILGVLRGTAFGPIKDAGTLLGTAYGITWLLALNVAVGVFLWVGT